jgi:predicted metal-dependent peptidase
MNTADRILEKLTKARVQLLFHHPFFASLCLRLAFVAEPVQTLETDGRAIYYSEKYVESLTSEELEGVLAHEAMHCALGHHCRRGKRCPERWNDACDYAINPLLLEGGLTLPRGVLNKKEFEGLSAEEIYSRLPDKDGNAAGQNRPQSSNDGGSAGDSPQQSAAHPQNEADKNRRRKQQASQGNGTPGTPHDASSATSPQPGSRPWAIGDVRDAVSDNGDPASEAEKEEQARDWAVAAEQAERIAKMCGKTPLGTSRVLAESRQSKKDWRDILRDFIAATTPSDYRFCPPNRRHVHAGLYLPSIHREGVGRLVIGVDTSGSIARKELEQFAAEITAISEQVHPEAIYVVYCDKKVHLIQEFLASEPITLTPKGGGGTSFRPVFKWIEANDIQPVCLIYLSDLVCNEYPASQPDYPVLWVTDSRRTAPFGETVQIIAE